MILQDGLGLHPSTYPCTALGNKTLTPGKTAVVQGDATCKVSSVSIPTARDAKTEKVPIGARFTIDGETAATEHTVSGRTQGAGTGVNEKQSVTITDATGGTFTLTWGGLETTDIAYDADAATVAAALVALDDGYEAADWTATGGPCNTDPVIIEFTGALANGPRALMVIDDSGLTGAGSEAGAVAQTQAGVVLASSDVTTELTFTPVLGAGTYATDAAITFLPQQLTIKIGDGNIQYTEKSNMIYDKDRGLLDTVREGDEEPMEVKLEATFEHITQGTSEPVSPMDALKGVLGGAEWINAAADPCEPYAIYIIVDHTPPCGTADDETVTFPDFRSETRDVSYKDAKISVSGKCNATEPTVVRS